MQPRCLSRGGIQALPTNFGQRLNSRLGNTAVVLPAAPHPAWAAAEPGCGQHRRDAGAHASLHPSAEKAPTGAVHQPRPTMQHRRGVSGVLRHPPNPSSPSSGGPIGWPPASPTPARLPWGCSRVSGGCQCPCHREHTHTHTHSPGPPVRSSPVGWRSVAGVALASSAEKVTLMI